MNSKLILLAERRERLLTRAAEQRLALVQNIEPWRIPLAVADRGMTAVRYILRRPEWIVGGVIALAVLRPRRVGKWIGRALVTWQMLDKLGNMSHTPPTSPIANPRLPGQFKSVRERS